MVVLFQRVSNKRYEIIFKKEYAIILRFSVFVYLLVLNVELTYDIIQAVCHVEIGMGKVRFASEFSFTKWWAKFASNC